MSETLSLVRDLISRPSVTPDDAGCQDVIAARLAALGFSIERFENNGVSNLWARHGTDRPIVCLAGHTDVVPTGPLDKWHTDPFQPIERDGKLYGRGAVDMKTGVAAFVTAAERFVRTHPDHAGSVALLITSDEEGPAVDGTVRVVEWLTSRGERLDFAIVGEPSSTDRFGDLIRNGRRGTLSGRMTVKGIQGHIAYPHLARNPIHEAAPVIAELVSTVWDEGNEHFPPTSFQISNIQGGTGAFNIIPGSVDIFFNFRFSTASTVESLKAGVVAALTRHRVEYELEWTLGGLPFLTPRGRLVDALSNAIHRVAGVTPMLSTGGGTSDGRFIATICDEVAEFGPLNATIHKLNEHVDVADIDRTHEIYFHTIEALLLGRE